MMNRKYILNVLYDLALTAGAEIHFKPLITKTLQRLMYHMDFPCGLLFLDSLNSTDKKLRLEAAIGDSGAIEGIGSEYSITLNQDAQGFICTMTNSELIGGLPCLKNHYKTVLKLPIPNGGLILLLSPKAVSIDFRLDLVFLPFLANFSKSVHLSRMNDTQVNALEYLVHTRTKALEEANAVLEKEIADRMWAEQELRTSENDLRSIFNNLQDAFVRCDNHGEIIKCSPSAVAMMRCDSGSLLGQNVGSFCVDKKEARRFIFALNRNAGTVKNYRLKLCGCDQQELWVSISARVYFDKSGCAAGVEGTARDISQIIQSQEILEDTARKNTQLLSENRRLARELIVTLEKERSHLSKELHDEMGQALTAINTQASIISANAREKGVISSAHEISKQINELFASIRAISKRLRPHLLDSLGLVESLKDLIAMTSKQSKLIPCFTCSGKLHDLPDITNITIYRVIQEALTNALRHSKADKIEILLSRSTSRGNSGGIIKLDIVDNGSGIDLNAMDATGLGLIGIRERITAVDGTFALTTSLGDGVRISIMIPLE